MVYREVASPFMIWRNCPYEAGQPPRLSRFLLIAPRAAVPNVRRGELPTKVMLMIWLKETGTCSLKFPTPLGICPG